MLRVFYRCSLSWRSISRTASRLSDTETKITILPIPTKEPQPLDDIKIDNIHLPPPVYTKPFEELFKDEPQTGNKHSDIADFVDNLGPPLPVSFNIAAYVNRSETLQNLVRLGVDLSRFDSKPEHAKYIITLDFEKDIRSHIQFLHDNGVSADDMGRIITKNPFLFKETIENLTIKVNYLISKRFTKDAVARILTSNPHFLSFETVFVDSRLGFFQKQFSLSGDEVRYLVTKAPRLISFPFKKIRENLFVFKEEFGYASGEIKEMLLMKPNILIVESRGLRERFEVVHNLMGISHEKIAKFPEIFQKRAFLLKQRHLYLTHLNKAQYDPAEPLYISLFDIATTTDVEFCKRCAKTSVDQYNEFLRTL